MNDVKTGRLKYSGVTHDSIEVSIVGDKALLIWQSRMEVPQADGSTKVFPLQMTTVVFHRGDAWKIGESSCALYEA